MYTLVKSEAKPLTRPMVEAFINLLPSPVERDLDPVRLKYLHEKAIQGKLVPFHWATAELEGKVFRVNGQHSSTMLHSLNGAFPENLIVHIDEYKTDSEADLAHLFRQMDDRRSRRTPSDIAGAYQGLMPPLRQVPKKIAKLGIEGAAWYRREYVGAPTPKGDDVYEMMNEPQFTDFLQWLGSLISMKTPELKHVAVIAAMFGTYENNPDEAKTFWGAVARGGDPHDDTDPAKVLSEWLQARKADKRVSVNRPANYFQGSIYAWNGYRDGKPVKDIRASTAKGWHSIQS